MALGGVHNCKTNFSIRGISEWRACERLISDEEVLHFGRISYLFIFFIKLTTFGLPDKLCVNDFFIL